MVIHSPLECSQNCSSPINLDFCLRRKQDQDLKEQFGLLHRQENPKRGHVYFTSSNNLVQHKVDDEQRTSLSGFSTGFKRKATNFELDLNLSLGLESRNDVLQNSTIPSSNYVLINKKLKEDFGTTKVLTTTLDLALSIDYK